MAHFIDCQQRFFPTSKKNNTKSIFRWNDAESVGGVGVGVGEGVSEGEGMSQANHDAFGPC
jgi:hypothetical protein